MTRAPVDESTLAAGLRGMIYTPPEVASAGRRAVESVRANALRALSIGIPGVRDYFAPLLPGEVASLIGQTSHGKSLMLDCIETHAARQLEDQGRTDEALVHISVEELIETQAFRLIARAGGESAGDLARGKVRDWDSFSYAVRVVGAIPIYRIGESLDTPEDAPELHLANMVRALHILESGGVTGKPVKIAGLFFDYLQAFPVNPEQAGQGAYEHQRRLQVREDVYGLFRAARTFRAPTWIAVQAKQTLSGALGPNMLTPGQYDGEETAAIGQRSDRVVTTWMPKQTHTVGAVLDHKGLAFTVTDNLMWVRVAKQRGNLPAGRLWPCRVDYEQNVIEPVPVTALNED